MMTNGQEYKICIDRDEEIMDVVDRLRRTPVSDIILVVPQHAMLLHSGVNLKILAYESHQMNKNITIMTNDEDGIALAQRAKIPTERYRGDDVPQKTAYVQPVQAESPLRRSMTRDVAARHLQQPSSVSVHDYKASGSVSQQQLISQQPQQPQPQPQPQPQQQEQYRRQEVQQQKQPPTPPLRATMQQSSVAQLPRAPQHFMRPPHQQRTTQKQPPSTPLSRSHTVAPSRVSAERTVPVHDERRSAQSLTQKHTHIPQSPARNTGVDAQRTQRSTPQQRMHHNSPEKHISSRKPRIVAFGLVTLAVVVLAVVALMLFLPLSHIAVHPRHATIDERVDMTARTDQQNIDVERRIVPARIIERDVAFTKVFTATGSGDAGAQKAQGKIVITNTDTAAQPLVATTRFVAENGTLFRLVNGVTVPAAKGDAPGTVEALVMADKAGAEGNIDPTTFRVPGLSGTTKQDKVTAKSDAAMVGGGSGGSGVALVTGDDLAAAKTATEQETQADVQSQIAALLRPDVEVLLPNALQMTQKQSEADVTAGTAQETFHYTTTTHVRAIVFSQEDVHTAVQSVFAERMASYGMEGAQLSVAYDDGDADFDAHNVKVGVRVTLDAAAHVDLAAFKEDIVGKKHDELRGIIEKKYMATIDKITISRVLPRFPAFIANRVSPISFMTSVDVVEMQ